MYARRNSKGSVELIKVNYMSYETIASEGVVNGVIVEHWKGKTRDGEDAILSYSYSDSDRKAQVFKPLFFKQHRFTPIKLCRVTLPTDMYNEFKSGE